MSFRSRLTIYCSAAIALVLVGGSVATYVIERNKLRDGVDATLGRQSDMVFVSSSASAPVGTGKAKVFTQKLDRGGSAGAAAGGSVERGIDNADGHLAAGEIFQVRVDLGVRYRGRPRGRLRLLRAGGVGLDLDELRLKLRRVGFRQRRLGIGRDGRADHRDGKESDHDSSLQPLTIVRAAGLEDARPGARA